MRYGLKLVITVSLLIAVLFSLGGSIMIATSFQSTLEKETQASIELFNSVQNTLALLCSLGEQTDVAYLSSVLEQIESQKLVSWQALELSTNNDSIYYSGISAMLKEAPALTQKDQYSYVYITDTFGNGIIFKSVLYAGETVLYLTVRYDLSHIYEMRAVQQKQYMLIYISVVIFGILASFVFSYALTKPLRKLTYTVRQISAGDLTIRSNLNTSDEIGQLSQDFDSMADRLESNIHQLEDELQRQERFMGAFAHELKTPMTSIIGFADLLRQDALAPPDRIEAAEYIYSEGHRLEQLSFKLLDLLFLEQGNITFRTVHIPDLIAEVENALFPTRENPEIQFSFESESMYMAIEPDLVKSLIYNLIDNAIRAIDHHGIIKVRATMIPGGCILVITDNGKGIPASEIEHITEAFYRIDKARSRAHGNVGLGLSLCAKIAALHNGHIKFDSEVGKGTYVSVTLYSKEGDSNEDA